MSSHRARVATGDEPYVATRGFWEQWGFVQIDCVDPLPGWQPGSPSGHLRRRPRSNPVVRPSFGAGR